MTAVRSIRALARAEAQYEEQGYDPVEAAHLIYDRAVRYYDSVFPDDELDFRQMLLNRRERSLVRAYARKRKEQLENQESFSERTSEVESQAKKEQA